MTARRKKIGVLLLLLAGILFYAATAIRITLNGSNSLPHTGYLMVAWPKPILFGSYVAVKPPLRLRDKFHADAVFVKRVGGVEGDRIVHGKDGLEICVRDTCYPLEVQDGKSRFAASPEGLIGLGRIALFGSAADSLDSRYGAVGLFPTDDVVAVGFPIALPHWKTIRTWIGDTS